MSHLTAPLKIPSLVLDVWQIMKTHYGIKEIEDFTDLYDNSIFVNKV